MAKSYLEEFREEMAPAEKLFTAEVSRFAKRFDCLGDMKLIEIPDIDTLDYIYAFKKLNGVSVDVLDQVRHEIREHMGQFCEIHGIQEFYFNTTITFKGELYERD